MKTRASCAQSRRRDRERKQNKPGHGFGDIASATTAELKARAERGGLATRLRKAKVTLAKVGCESEP